MSPLPLPPTISVGGHDYPLFDADIPEIWQEIAREKGFGITARVRDRFHLVLRHEECGQEMIARVFTLRTAEPICPSCLAASRQDLCQAAGAEFLGRGEHPNYLRIRLPCGHETQRQQELLARVGRGATGIRCEDCLALRLKEEAHARDWELISDDPDGHPGYRLYRHDCGHFQRVAVANMVTGRFTCGGCSDGWTRDASHIYLMRFVLKNGRDTLKPGFSRDPQSRLRHQLITDPDQYARLIRTVAVATGREAMRLEKALHLKLRRDHPDAVVDRAEFAGEVNVVSELYCASIEPEIMRLFDELEIRQEALARRRARFARRAGLRRSPPGSEG